MTTKKELEERLVTLEAELTKAKELAAGQELQLKQAQQMLQLIVDTIPMRVFWKDENLNYLGCNILFAHDAGQKSPAQLIGKSDFDMGWAEQAELYRADDQRVIDSGEARLNYEEPQTTPDGTEIWLRTSKTPLRDFEGQIIGILGIYDDITERHQIEEALRLSEQRAQAIVDSVPMGMHIFRLERDGRLVFMGANATADKLLGVDHSLFVDKTIEEVFPPLAQTEVPARYRAAAGQGEAWQTKQITYDNEEVQEAFEVYAFQTTPNNMVAAFLDVTERTRQEAELKRLAGIIEASPDFIGITNAQSQVTYINPAGLAMTGYTPEEFSHDLSVASFHPDFPPEAVATAVKEGTWTGEVTITHKNGHRFPVSQTISAIKDGRGNLKGFSTIARDISAQKQAEIERERLQKEIIEAQQRAITELSTPVIPIMDRIIVMPLIGSIDSLRARDITRNLLAGIQQHRAKVVILDVTGVAVMDTGVVNHLNKTIQAARLKGARTIVTGIPDSVAEAIVDLGIDWSSIETLSDLQTGLVTALDSLGVKLSR